jgi:hypothetical protein
MKTVPILAAALVAASGCTATDLTRPPEPGAIRIAGHPYWTMPRLGLPRGFANSDLDIGSPVVSTPGGMGF